MELPLTVVTQLPGPLAPEHHPKVAKYNHKEGDISKPSLLGKSIEMTNTTDLPDVLTNDESADLTEKLNVEKLPRYSRIQKHKSDSIRSIRPRIKMVRTSSITSLSSIGSPEITMGGSCSTQLEMGKAKVKALEEKLKLHESGITTSNEMRSSQTNLGLVSFGLETSTNGDCECNSMWGILEILGTIVVCIIIMFIGYRCLNRLL